MGNDGRAASARGWEVRRALRACWHVAAVEALGRLGLGVVGVGEELGAEEERGLLDGEERRRVAAVAHQNYDVVVARLEVRGQRDVGLVVGEQEVACQCPLCRVK